MRKGLWIALEGADAVGKSTQIPMVAVALRKCGGLLVAEIPEFSDSPVGTAILAIISENRFFSLDNKTTPFADLLTTLSDLAYLYEKTISPILQVGGVALSDRSPASPLAYQLTPKLGNLEQNGEKLFTAVASMISECSLCPDLSVILRLSEVETIRRIINRGEPPPTESELTYLLGVQSQLRQAARLTSKEVVEVDGSPSIEKVTASIVDICLEKISQS